MTDHLEENNFAEVFEPQLRAFYAEYGEWPIFERLADGEYLAVTKEEVDEKDDDRAAGGGG